MEPEKNTIDDRGQSKATCLRGYKMTEVGAIPEDWVLFSLGHLFTFLSTATYSRDHLLSDGYALYVHYGDIHTKWNHFIDFIVDELPFIAKEKVLGFNPIKEGDLIVADVSEDYIGIGKSVEVKNIGTKVAISGLHTFLLRNYSSNLANGYKGYMLVNRQVKRQLDRLATGIKVYGISKTKLKNVLIPIPPTKAEQTAIANALSDADALIQSLTRFIAKKRQIKQGAMQTLLNPYENGRLKEGWDTITYGEAFGFLSTASFSRSALTNNGEYEYIHYGDIHTLWHGFVDFNKVSAPAISAQKAKGYALVKDGDLVMADASEDYEGIGKSVEIVGIGNKKVISGLHTFLLRDSKRVFVNGYRGYINTSGFVKKQFDRLATGLKVYGISKAKLKTVDIPLPLKEEQTHIATILSDMDTEISALESKLAKYQQIKQGMMQNLLTGRIRLV